MVGCVGESLTLYRHAVVVAVGAAGLAQGRAVEPVAGVDLGCRLIGPDLEAAAGDCGTELCGYFQTRGTVEYPAVVIAFSVFQGREVSLDVSSPVGMRASEVASQREALSFSTWSRIDPLSSPSRFQ